MLRFELDIQNYIVVASSTTAPSTTTTAVIENTSDPLAANNNAVVETNKNVEINKNLSLFLGDLAISEKSTVLQLKQKLFHHWKKDFNSNIELSKNKFSILSSLPTSITPKTANHLRIRDFKGGKISGPLRDDRLIGRCLLGLSDGRKIIVQVLDNEEHIGADDLILSVRLLSYEKKTMSLPFDLPITRSGNISDLLNKLLVIYPFLKEDVVNVADSDNYNISNAENNIFSTLLPDSKYISIAKGFSTGPSITLKSALKLKWNDATVLKDGLLNSLDRPPLNLRDGSIILVRGNADFARAQATIKARKLAAGIDVNGSEEIISAGAGSVAVRARLRSRSASSRSGRRLVTSTSQKNTVAVEKSLSIVDPAGTTAVAVDGVVAV
jgi:hypothetical protein